MENTIPNLSSFDLSVHPLVTEKREWICKILHYNVYRVFGKDFDTYVAAFGGKNAVIRTDDFLGSYAYHFLSLSFLEDFLLNPTIDESLHLIV